MKETDFELNEELRKEIGELLKRKREELNYSTNQIMQKTGIDKADISRIENGKKAKLNPVYLRELAKVLNVDVLELFKKIGYLDEQSLSISKRKEAFNLEKAKVNTVILPVYGKASAGNGYLNLDNEIYFMPIRKGTFSKDSFLVEISGESMYPTLEDGDYALVDPNNIDYEKNKIYVVTYNDETFIKRVFDDPKNNMIVLKSDNHNYDDIYISYEERDYFKIEGRVIQRIANQIL